MTDTAFTVQELEPSTGSGDPAAPDPVDPRPPGAMCYRAAEVLDVRWPDRIVEVNAHPYEQEAIVVMDGRAVTEVCERGAYNGIERRAGRVKANRDHDLVRTVGRVIELFPDRDEGLIARMRISRTPLGDETLELAGDQALDASVCYSPFPNSQKWSRDRRQVRLTKNYLHHIALVPEPAYEGANVLAVRSAVPPATIMIGTASSSLNGATAYSLMPAAAAEPVSTPNIEQVLAWLDSPQYHLRATE